MTTRPAAIAGSNRKATTARAQKAEPKAPMSEREEVSIMHVLTEPTSSSSGAQMSGSPLNSGGPPTTIFGLSAAESKPRRAELQVVLAL